MPLRGTGSNQAIGGWRLAVGSWRLVVVDWWLVAVGSGWQLAVARRWWLAAVVGWRLVPESKPSGDSHLVVVERGFREGVESRGEGVQEFVSLYLPGRVPQREELRCREAGRSLRDPIFCLLRTAPRDHQPLSTNRHPGFAWRGGGLWGQFQSSYRAVTGGRLLAVGNAVGASGGVRAVLNGEKKLFRYMVFFKNGRVYLICSTMVGGDWRLAAGGDCRLAVGSSWLAAVGGSWQLVMGGWWRLAAVDGWWLVVPWGGP